MEAFVPQFLFAGFDERVLLMSLSGLCALGRITEELLIWPTGFFPSLSSVGVVRASCQCSGEVEEWGPWSAQILSVKEGWGGVGLPPAPGMLALDTNLRNLVKAALFSVLGLVHDALGSHARSTFHVSFVDKHPFCHCLGGGIHRWGRRLLERVHVESWSPPECAAMSGRQPIFGLLLPSGDVQTTILCIFATLHSCGLSISKWVCCLLMKIRRYGGPWSVPIFFGACIGTMCREEGWPAPWPVGPGWHPVDVVVRRIW